MVQLKAAVAELMAAVRALPPLSMEAVNAAARLALPQVGYSNPRCDSAGYLLKIISGFLLEPEEPEMPC